MRSSAHGSAEPNGSKEAAFTVGDVGYLDEDGYLYVVDRVRDMVVSGGVNICTTEVESVLHEHPEVHDVAVVGVPSKDRGEQVHAIVQPEPGTQLDEHTLATWLADRLADFKHPRSYEFRGELPRDEAGKMRKRELREPYWQGADRRI